MLSYNHAVVVAVHEELTAFSSRKWLTHTAVAAAVYEAKTREDLLLLVALFSWDTVVATHCCVRDEKSSWYVAPYYDRCSQGLVCRGLIHLSSRTLGDPAFFHHKCDLALLLQLTTLEVSAFAGVLDRKGHRVFCRVF